MIQRLGASTLSFKANEVSSARDSYNAKVDSNSRIAQNQNNIVSSKVVATNGANSQIAMQGNGGTQLNVVA